MKSKAPPPTPPDAAAQGRTPRRPILIGHAEEIPNPNIREDVHRMLDNEGLYIGGDTLAQNVIVPYWSSGGKVWSMMLDKELDPERFNNRATFRGPFTPDPKDDPVNTTLSARLAQAEGEVAKATAKQPINTHVRLFDLVRQMRAELHQAELITDEEYAWLAGGSSMAHSKTGGSPSPRRLEDYDDIKARAALCDEMAEALKLADEPFASHEMLYLKLAVEKTKGTDLHKKAVMALAVRAALAKHSATTSTTKKDGPTT